MAKHLSIRLPWHDRGWDRHVCDRPTANVYCTGEYGLKAHSIRENKKDDEEEAIAGKPCGSIKKGAYLPPCLRTIQTFGGTKNLPWVHTPKDFLSTDDITVSPIPEPKRPVSPPIPVRCCGAYIGIRARTRDPQRCRITRSSIAITRSNT
jgi:hypothetical protein